MVGGCVGPDAAAVSVDPDGVTGLEQRCASAGAGDDDPWRDAGFVSGLTVAADLFYEKNREEIWLRGAGHLYK